jgi:hypothetical protein
MKKQIPIMASKKAELPPKVGGIKTACSLCAAIGKSRTTNQMYTYVMVYEDDGEDKADPDQGGV